jgi:hypothetical protein
MCVAGWRDFDALGATLVLTDGWVESYEPVVASAIPAFQTTRLDIVALDPRLIEDDESHYDALQRMSSVQYFEFCGAKVFRALAMERGFVFA